MARPRSRPLIFRFRGQRVACPFWVDAIHGAAVQVFSDVGRDILVGVPFEPSTYSTLKRGVISCPARGGLPEWQYRG